MSSSNVNDAETTPSPEDYKKIVEGSITMKFSKDQEEAVFYNPVQVQNRDLSILMICLYNERRHKRKLIKQHKKELRQANPSWKENQVTEKAKEYERTVLTESYISKSLEKEQEAEASSPKNKNGMTIFEALAASGLRSLRYWKEIPNVKHITINDLDPTANERALHNIETNDLKKDLVQDEDDKDDKPYGLRIRHGDATHEMYMCRRAPGLHTPKPHQLCQSTQYDVVDLDPYGSAAPFLDSALQAVTNGGLLCVTCTDMAALGGAHPEQAYGRYGSIPISRATYLQEMALRILLHTMAISAAKYGRTIKPILSVGMNFYIRVFVEVNDDKAGVQNLSLKIGNVYQSTQCPSFHTIPHGMLNKKGKKIYQPTRAPATPTCEETGGPFKIGGPIWLGPLHDQEVVETALKRVSPNKQTHSDDAPTLYPNLDFIATRDRIAGLLTSVSEELTDVPLYYQLPNLSHTLKCTSPPLQQFKAALLNAGYRVSGYHKDPQAIKTDAPNRVVWDIMRVWCEKHPPTPHSKSSQKKRNRRKKRLGKNETDGDDEKNNNAEEGDEDEDGDATGNNNGGGGGYIDTPGKILAIKPSIEVDFTIPRGGVGTTTGVARFPMNPEKNWGPKPASGIFSKKRKAEDSSTTATTTTSERANQGEPDTKKNAVESK